METRWKARADLFWKLEMVDWLEGSYASCSVQRGVKQHKYSLSLSLSSSPPYPSRHNLDLWPTATILLSPSYSENMPAPFPLMISGSYDLSMSHLGACSLAAFSPLSTRRR